jgi:hypothetical protein
LAAQAQVAPPGPVGVIGWLTVLVEHQRQPVGGLAQLLGGEIGGDPGELGFGVLPGLVIHPAGQVAEKPAMIATCSAPMRPRACAAAVRGRIGASGWPVIAVRGPSSTASLMRRRASLPLMCNPVASTCGNEVPPNACGQASARNRGAASVRKMHADNGVAPADTHARAKSQTEVLPAASLRSRGIEAVQVERDRAGWIGAEFSGAAGVREFAGA